MNFKVDYIYVFWNLFLKTVFLNLQIVFKNKFQKTWLKTMK